MNSPDQSPQAVVERHWRAWAKQDKRTTLSLCSDDIVFSLYVPEHVLAFGGETRGKPSVSDRLQTVIDQFETLVYEGRAPCRRRHRARRRPLLLPPQGNGRGNRG